MISSEAPFQEPVITVKNVGVRYKRRGGLFRPARYHQVFEGLSLEVYRGETLGIVGRNGAGKSTLLRLLAGIIEPDSGRVINHGYTVSLLALQAGFDGQLPGRDNALFMGMLLGYTRVHVLSKLGEIEKFAELGKFFMEPVKTYSTGMRARLGFSVAMHLQPEVLLLDEVLAVGDKQFRKKAEVHMAERMQSDRTTVLVSHNESHIKNFCSRAIKI